MRASRRRHRVHVTVFVLGIGMLRPLVGNAARPDPPPKADNLILQWNSALLQAVRNVRFPPMHVARALAIAHTCMYDAWAEYDAWAISTVRGESKRRTRSDHNPDGLRVAVSHAAYRALIDLFPTQQAMFDALMQQIGLDPSDQSTQAAGVGNAACADVLEMRHQDGSNQLGDLNGGAPYSDYTGYAPFNTPDMLIDPNRWQPLRSPAGVVQQFIAPHWGLVKPFALTSPDQFRPRLPVLYPDEQYVRQTEELRGMSAALGDREKVIAEYWADGPGSETPPGHWSLLAQSVSRRDGHDLDTDVKMFFILGNALLDASISVWDCKVASTTCGR